MKKVTFKEFLTEVDVGDLQLAQQHQQQQAAHQARYGGAQDYKQKMAAASPSKGDIVQTTSGKFQVVNMDTKGIYIKPLAGNGQVSMLPQGAKFQNAGKTPAGKNLFQLL